MDSDDSAPLPIPPRKPFSPDNRKPHSQQEDRERVTSSSRELARRLAYEQRETKDLHRVLYNLTEQLRAETHRADEAEQRVLDVVSRLKTINEARVVAVQEVAKLNAQLELYKIQLNAAQKEIFRAQDILNTFDAQRYEAEKDAAKARTTARRLHGEKLVDIAREEGRRLGVQEGFEQGKDYATYQATMAQYNHVMEQGAFDNGYEPDRRSPSPEEIIQPDEAPPLVRQAQRSSPPIPTPIRTIPSQHSNEVHPIHNIPPSPRHPKVTIPPDNYIPQLGLDSIIHLPPPHEMSRPPPTPERSGSPSLPPVPEKEPLMVPTPIPASHRRRGRRQSSPESNSTTISQLEIVNDPLHPPSERRSPLSVIQEVLSTHTSPNPHTNYPTPHNASSSDISMQPIITMNMAAPSSAIPVLRVSGVEDHARHHNVYSRPHSSSSSSEDSRIGLAPARRKSNSSLSTVPDINIQPPSRPQSNGARQSDGTPARMGNFLSPADANRPVPLPDRPPNTVPSTAENNRSSSANPVASGTVGATPIVLPSGQFPLGFVPMGNGFVSPSAGTPRAFSADYSSHYSTLAKGDGAFTIPGGYSEPQASTAGPQPPRQRLGDVMIPNLELDSDEDAVSSGISSDADTLTTPPARRKNIYGDATTGTSRFTAAGVPLPSTAGGTPWSGFNGSMYSPNAPTNRSGPRNG